MKKETIRFKKVGIFSRKSLAGRKTLVKTIIKALEKQGCAKILYDQPVAKLLGVRSTARTKIGESVDLIVTLGGDGTLIRVAHNLGKQKPVVLSINMGTLGFLTEVHDPSKAVQAIEQVFKGKYNLDERTLLRVTHYSKGEKKKTFLALNEAVINQGNFARLINLRSEIDQRKMINFKADGVIIATPTGSTGHSLSAGGPIVHPKLDAFIFTPICPSELSNRPIAIPNHRQLKIIIDTMRKWDDNAIGLTVDGQKTIPVHYGDEIKIRKSSRTLNLIRFGGSRYYKVLRDKLGWGKLR